MPKTYQISNNIIFSVNDDGSISKFASINESGEITRIGKSHQCSKSHKVLGYWLIMIFLLGMCVALFCLYNNVESNYQCQQNRTRTIESKYNEAQRQFSVLTSEKESLAEGKVSAEEALSTLKQKVGDSYPLIISDIEIANVTYNGDIETDYGNTLYSNRTMYLKHWRNMI